MSEESKILVIVNKIGDFIKSTGVYMNGSVSSSEHSCGGKLNKNLIGTHSYSLDCKKCNFRLLLPVKVITWKDLDNFMDEKNLR